MFILNAVSLSGCTEFWLCRVKHVAVKIPEICVVVSGSS